MQKKIQNNSPIKQKILQFVESLNISKREFYEKTGISRGTIDNTTGITEDTLTKLFATFPNINKNWLFGDSDQMLIEKDYSSGQQNTAKNTGISEPQTEYNQKELIESLKKTIEILNNQLSEANKDKETYRKLLESKLNIKD